MVNFQLLFKIAWHSLIRTPVRRTITVLLTVAMGTGSLFLFHGFNNGVMNQYREHTIRGRFGNGQINTLGYRDQVFEKPWQHWIENSDEIIGKLKSVDGVVNVFPRVEFPALITNGSVNFAGRGQGVVAAHEAGFFTTLEAAEGEKLTTQEDGIFLGKGLARSLNVKVGSRVTVLANTVSGSFNALEFTVVGIFHTGQKEYDDMSFRVQLSKAQEILNTAKIENLTVGLKEVNDWPKVAALIQKEFPNLEATPFEILDKYFYQNAVDWLDAQFNVIQSIILFVVVLGIFNTISTAVLERKQEIGSLRANGDSRAEVVGLFCAESLALGIVGALIGIVGTYLLTVTVLSKGILMPTSPGFTRQFYVLIDLNVWMAIKVFVLGSLCSFVGSFVASIRVAKMPIAEALRSN